MKTQSIAATMGVGVHFVVVGGLLIGVGIAELLGFAFPEAPVGIWYLVVGGLALVFGAYAVSYSTEKAEKKIEKHLTVQAQVKRQPWVVLGIAAGAGYLLSQLFTSRRSFTQDDADAIAERVEKAVASAMPKSGGAKPSPSRDDQWVTRNRPNGQANARPSTRSVDEKDDTFFGELAETAKRAMKQAVMTAAVSAISAAGGAVGGMFAAEDDRRSPSSPAERRPTPTGPPPRN